MKKIPVAEAVGTTLCHDITRIINTTVFDIALPRIFAGERLTRGDIVGLGHGGYCLECDICRYPACAFGKSAGV